MPDLAFAVLGLVLLLVGGTSLLFPTHAKAIFHDENTPGDANASPPSHRNQIIIRLCGAVLTACGLAMVYVSFFGANGQPADDIPGL